MCHATRDGSQCKAEAQHCGGWGADPWFVWLMFSAHPFARPCNAEPDQGLPAGDDRLASAGFALPLVAAAGLAEVAVQPARRRAEGA